MNKKEDIGKKISAIRKEQGMTQRELAEKIHVTDKSVSKWETGTHFPDIAIMEDLARALGISVVELLGLENVAPEKTIEALTLISLEEKEDLQKEMKFRLWISIIALIATIVFEVYFFFFLYNNGLKGLEYRTFTIGLIGALAGVLSNTIDTLINIRKI